MFWNKKKEEEEEETVSETPVDIAPPIDQKPFLQAIWPVIACGAGLFSDGYVNNVCSPTILQSGCALSAYIFCVLRHLGHRLSEHGPYC